MNKGSSDFSFHDSVERVGLDLDKDRGIWVMT